MWDFDELDEKEQAAPAGEPAAAAAAGVAGSADAQSPAVARRPRRALLTGASGLLGRQVLLQFERRGWAVRGLAFTRCSGPLVKCNILERGELEAQFRDFQPSVVIHCAAERRPGNLETDPEYANRINVEASRCIGELSREHGAWLVFLSTNYVFDGKGAPYAEDAVPNPLSVYGRSKLDGERATSEACPRAAVLRVPLLYGPLDNVDETTVSTLLATLLELAGAPEPTPKAFDNWQERYPTSTEDLAAVLESFCGEAADAGPERHEDFAGIFHWQANEMQTRYTMALAVAEIAGVDRALVSKSDDAPSELSAPRPQFEEMRCTRLERLIGKDQEIQRFRSDFRQGLRRHLQPFLPKAKAPVEEVAIAAAAPTAPETPAASEAPAEAETPATAKAPAAASEAPAALEALAAAEAQEAPATVAELPATAADAVAEAPAEKIVAEVPPAAVGTPAAAEGAAAAEPPAVAEAPAAAEVPNAEAVVDASAVGAFAAAEAPAALEAPATAEAPAAAGAPIAKETPAVAETPAVVEAPAVAAVSPTAGEEATSAAAEAPVAAEPPATAEAPAAAQAPAVREMAAAVEAQAAAVEAPAAKDTADAALATAQAPAAAESVATAADSPAAEAADEAPETTTQAPTAAEAIGAANGSLAGPALLQPGKDSLLESFRKQILAERSRFHLKAEADHLLKDMVRTCEDLDELLESLGNLKAPFEAARDGILEAVGGGGLPVTRAPAAEPPPEVVPQGFQEPPEQTSNPWGDMTEDKAYVDEEDKLLQKVSSSNSHPWAKATFWDSWQANGSSWWGQGDHGSSGQWQASESQDAWAASAAEASWGGGSAPRGGGGGSCAPPPPGAAKHAGLGDSSNPWGEMSGEEDPSFKRDFPPSSSVHGGQGGDDSWGAWGRGLGAAASGGGGRGGNAWDAGGDSGGQHWDNGWGRSQGSRAAGGARKADAGPGDWSKDAAPPARRGGAAAQTDDAWHRSAGSTSGAGAWDGWSAGAGGAGGAGGGGAWGDWNVSSGGAGAGGAGGAGGGGAWGDWNASSGGGAGSGGAGAGHADGEWGRRAAGGAAGAAPDPAGDWQRGQWGGAGAGAGVNGSTGGPPARSAAQPPPPPPQGRARADPWASAADPWAAAGGQAPSVAAAYGGGQQQARAPAPNTQRARADPWASAAVDPWAAAGGQVQGAPAAYGGGQQQPQAPQPPVGRQVPQPPQLGADWGGRGWPPAYPDGQHQGLHGGGPPAEAWGPALQQQAQPPPQQLQQQQQWGQAWGPALQQQAQPPPQQPQQQQQWGQGPAGAARQQWQSKLQELQQPSRAPAEEANPWDELS